MAKAKACSPKKSRRGRRSPKKSKKGVQHKILKGESEPAQMHVPLDLEAGDEQDHECEMNAEPVEESQPEPIAEVNEDGVATAKEMLVQFFSTQNEAVLASAMSLSQLPEQLFIFGKVASVLAANGAFDDEVEANLGIVWKADETWTRSLLAGDVKPAEPEPIEEEAAEQQPETVAPEEAVMPEAVAEESPEAVEEAEPAIVEEPKEVEMEETAEAVETMETEVETVQPFIPEPPATEAQEVPKDPIMQELPSIEPIDKENNATINLTADAGKMSVDKLGEQSAWSAPDAPLDDGLIPKNVLDEMSVNFQPMDFA